MPLIKVTKVEYTVQVKKVYKGNIKDTVIKVITGTGNGDCGFNFVQDNEYIIYCFYDDRYYGMGDKVDKFLSTSTCSRTRLSSDKKEIDELEKIYKKYKLIKWFIFLFSH